MKNLQGKLTYANLVATLALFLVVAGGTAFAATKLSKNSVGSKQIKKNAVTSAKIKKEAVTGAKIKLSSLGTVPSADTAANANALGGIAPSGYLSADHLITGHASFSATPPATIFTDPRTGLRVTTESQGLLGLVNTNASDTIVVDLIGFNGTPGQPNSRIITLKAGEKEDELGFEAYTFAFGVFQAQRLTSGDPSLSFTCMSANEQYSCVGMS